MNVILATSGSGFLGRHLIGRLLNNYQDIKIRKISRSENTTRKMLGEFHSERLTPIVGDTRNIDSVKYALRDADTTVHLAQMKHIDLCDTYPLEAIATDVIGTMNLLDLFEKDIFVGMSTDKAIESTTCYGAIKLLVEKMV